MKSKKCSIICRLCSPPYLKNRSSFLFVIITVDVNCLFMKLFKTGNIDVVKCCQDHFGFDLPSLSWSKRFGLKKFETKVHDCNNLLCNVLWICTERPEKTVNCCNYSYFVWLSLVKFCFYILFCYRILWWNKAVFVIGKLLTSSAIQDAVRWNIEISIHKNLERVRSTSSQSGQNLRGPHAARQRQLSTDNCCGPGC